MGIDAEDFRIYVIRPTLQKLDIHSPAAELLLMGTAAAESELGAFLKTEGQRTAGSYRMHGVNPPAYNGWRIIRKTGAFSRSEWYFRAT